MVRERVPCSFNHENCNFFSRGACRLLLDTDFHGKDCHFFATKEQVRENRRRARDRLIRIGAADLLNYSEYYKRAHGGNEKEK